MPIFEKHGRFRSERSNEDINDILLKDLKGLSAEERECLEIILQQMREDSDPEPAQEEEADRTNILEVFNSRDYHTRPVDLETFVKDPYYLGVTCDNIYPQLLEDLKEIFSGGYTEAIFTGSIGYGKTFVSSIGICRVLYELSCMRNPQRTLGLASEADNIAIVGFSVTEELAQKVVFENITSKLRASPYFKDKFPFKGLKAELRFKNKILVTPRSTTDTAVLGLNVLAAILDETNFMPIKAKRGSSPGGDLLSQAEKIYNQVKRRVKSRYGNSPMAKIFVVSSKLTPDDFTEKLIRASGKDPTVFVRDYPLWGPKKKGTYSEETFPVLCGNDRVPSRILEYNTEEYESYRDDLPEGCVLVDVPEDFRIDFVRDLEGSLRDIAGVATMSISPFIQRRDKISGAQDFTREHPFTVEVYDPSKGGAFMWDRLVERKVYQAFGGEPSAAWQPRVNPTASRHIHIDPALKKDALGIVMAHVGGWKDVERVAPQDRRVYRERAPFIVVDFALKVIPPVGDEIILSDIRHLIYQLSAHGFTITSISCDSHQSVDTLQQFARKGYNAQLVSVDKTMDPYLLLKEALYEDRVSMYPYPPLLEELVHLQEDKKKRKVDHDAWHSKDVADCLAAVTYTLSSQEVAAPLPFIKSESNDLDMLRWTGGFLPTDDMADNVEVGISPAGDVSRGGGAVDLPPFLGGMFGSGPDYGDF